MSQTEQVLSGLPGNVLAGLRAADQRWGAIQAGEIPIPTAVQESSQRLDCLEWDVVICGGTLGIFVGAALAKRGLRVALIERGILQGRVQEWNVSRQELGVFLELNLLDENQLQQAIVTAYNPARVSFHEGTEIWVKDVLNIGVDPVFLLAALKEQFLQAGGQLFENMPFQGAVVHPNGVQVNAGNGFKTRLLIDAMGHFSPIIQQVRKGKKPDGICLVVGSCAQGFPQNETGDLFASFTPIQHHCQYFWEAFPAKDGRTTYLFTYLDAHPDRLSLEFLFDEYFRLLPAYQNIEIEQLTFQRALFGFFPSYRESPVQLPWGRILPVGDSSGSQSPLSFGGFGAMLRHLQRLSAGISEALQVEALTQPALALLQPYQPSLSVTWLFQKAMTVGMNQTVEPNQINQLLSAVFTEMQKLGEPVLKPFLQDVIQFSALSQTLLKTSMSHPGLIAKLTPSLGIMPLLDWMRHYLNLATYRTLWPVGQGIEPWIKNLPEQQQYYYHQWLEAWKYGSGSDYETR
jgi:lycopene cyclase CruP